MGLHPVGWWGGAGVQGARWGGQAPVLKAVLSGGSSPSPAVFQVEVKPLAGEVGSRAVN